jgi:hypothetical protein
MFNEKRRHGALDTVDNVTRVQEGDVRIERIVEPGIEEGASDKRRRRQCHANQFQ